jgi:hypothetical protein
MSLGGFVPDQIVGISATPSPTNTPIDSAVFLLYLTSFILSATSTRNQPALPALRSSVVLSEAGSMSKGNQYPATKSYHKSFLPGIVYEHFGLGKAGKLCNNSRDKTERNTNKDGTAGTTIASE